MFKDRAEAGMLLAKQLEAYTNTRALVLGIPRGGVVVAKEIADALRLPLDIIVIRKIGHPDNPELAIGAAGLDTFIIDESFPVPLSFVEQAVEEQQQEVKRRYAMFRGKKPMYSAGKRTIILIDDGVATGATIKMAIQILKEQGAKEIIVAIPVAPPETIRELEAIANKVICLEQPHGFMAVGQFYHHFPQVEDEEVAEILEKRP